VLFEEGKGAIVQEIGSRDRRLLGVELAKPTSVYVSMKVYR
jgi:hypothetical protein